MKTGSYLPKINIFFLIAFFLSSITLAACATTKVMRAEDAEKELKLEKYNTVYLSEPKDDEDPRDVFPKVVSRLKELGLNIKVLSQDGPNEGTQGTGFIIDEKGHMLTCEHVLHDADAATVWLKGQRYDASILKVDAEKDLVLLRLEKMEGIQVQPLQLSRSPDYRMGQDVYTIGYPLSDILGTSPRFTKGMISSTVGLKDDPDHLQVSAEIQPGNSGGPLLNENGQVIGILQATLNPMNIFARTGGSLPQNVNFAVKMNLITDFLDENESETISPADDIDTMTFDEVSNSVVLVRAGNITEEFLTQLKAYCKVSYISIWDMWYRFRAFQLEFFDYESGDLIIRVGQYGDGVFTTEDKVIDKVFEELRIQLQGLDTGESEQRSPD